jgi:beta-galactosidase
MVWLAASSETNAKGTDNLVRFTIEGPANLIATDNGDPTSHEPFEKTDRKAFNGMCLAIVGSRAGHRGKITFTAEADGLKSAQVTLDSK